MNQWLLAFLIWWLGTGTLILVGYSVFVFFAVPTPGTKISYKEEDPK